MVEGSAHFTFYLTISMGGYKSGAGSSYLFARSRSEAVSTPARRVGTGREQAEGGCRRQGWGWGWGWGWGCSSSYVPTSPRPRSSRGLSAEMSSQLPVAEGWASSKCLFLSGTLSNRHVYSFKTEI